VIKSAVHRSHEDCLVDASGCRCYVSVTSSRPGVTDLEFRPIRPSSGVLGWRSILSESMSRDRIDAANHQAVRPKLVGYSASSPLPRNHFTTMSAQFPVGISPSKRDTFRQRLAFVSRGIAAEVFLFSAVSVTKAARAVLAGVLEPWKVFEAYHLRPSPSLPIKS
jgi:hypothetical protein